MKKRLQTWWQRRSVRERLTIYLAALVAAGALVDYLALAPTREQAAREQVELRGAKAELNKIRAAVEQQAQESQNLVQRRRDELLQRQNRAEDIIREAQVDLITPQQMKRELAAILEKFPQMRIVAMRSSAPMPLGVISPAKAPASDAPAQAPSKGPAPVAVTGLYQHGLEVTVEGRYLDLIGYLQTLEHAPHRVYWRELELAVNDKGIPVTKIGLFTLSRDAIWLSL